MRFKQNGPSIPDELLTARDEGRVVFFCGAGVSQADAGLPGFFDLAKKVIQGLHVGKDSPALKIFEESREIETRTKVSGLISADRIFGFLEREFSVRDIESEVAKALRPPAAEEVPQAHRTLLNLATTPEGNVRLVTTNFDRLFHDCGKKLKAWKPQRLYDPSHFDEMDGIIYLHGRANNDYTNSEDEGFILSISQFGRAYLSDGWATRFFKEIISRYIVVFVGYSADDPPVQYLLEGLNNKGGRLNEVYAFQPGTSEDADEMWRHKGVKAISYSEEDEHKDLWETLKAWAERAKGPEEWSQSIVELARKGPENLQPHERGQIAHIVSTLEGARLFSEAEPPPPAEWLCVFDPQRRYAKPGHIYFSLEPGPFVDPFDLYGLDSDIPPGRIHSDDYSSKRDIPGTAWDAFVPNRIDRQNFREGSFPAIRGRRAIHMPGLPPRLQEIAFWIGRVADQPASIWWAAKQVGLHPDIQWRIKSNIERAQKDVSSVIRKAWLYLFESWDGKIGDLDSRWDRMKAVSNKDGWDRTTIRKYIAINQPCLKVTESSFGGPKPPEKKEELKMRDLFLLDVEYPSPPIFQRGMKIPDKCLEIVLSGLRKNLEHALQLEIECDGYGLRRISPLVFDDGANYDYHGRTRGLSGNVILFSSFFDRLMSISVDKARQEFAAWPVDDDTIFSRLRIWASGKAELISGQAFGEIIADLSDDAFWSGGHQRDFLLVLAKRWKELQNDFRERMEQRLLDGPRKWPGEDKKKYKNRRAWKSLDRIVWMENEGCDFIFDFKVEIKKLRLHAPEWKPEYAKKAADSMEGHVGSVRTETEYSLLLDIPIRTILLKAHELNQRRGNFFLKRDPFAGLSLERPLRAFSALTDAAKQNEYPEWAWRTFLSLKARKNDKPKFLALIAERISRYPDEGVAIFVDPSTDWLERTSRKLAADYPRSFKKLISKFMDAIRFQSPGNDSTIVEKSDWAMEEFSFPVGKIAKALLNYPEMDQLKTDDGLPDEWREYAENLLSLGGDLRRHAILPFARYLNWFYGVDLNWTETFLLSVLEGDKADDKDAFWSGCLWFEEIPCQKLYARIKSDLLSLARGASPPKRRNCGALARIILSGWGSIDKKTQQSLISNDEMRDVLLCAGEDFRCHILWQFRGWLKSDENGVAEKWSGMAQKLIRDVWPRQRSIKTSKMSTRLCDFVFLNVRGFSEMVENSLPLLTVIDGENLMLPNFRESRDSTIDIHPDKTLKLLHAVLPDRVTAWPYDMSEIIQRIGEADHHLNSDKKFIELKRKWNAR